MHVLCTAVNVVYHCNCYVVYQCVVYFLFVFSSVATTPHQTTIHYNHTKSLFCYTILGHTLTLVEQHMYMAVKLDHKSLNNLFSIPSTYLPVPTPLLSTRSNHNQNFLHYHTSVNCYKSQEQYQSGMISRPTRIIQCKSLDILNQYLQLYNCMLHISPYAPGGLW